MRATFYRFGDFRLYPTEQLLLRGNGAIPLTPKAFELLCVLAGSGGRLLPREELMQAVWQDSFVEEINLTVNISLLRKILGTEPDGSAYIVTVPKRGYRFTPTVTEDFGSVGEAAGETTSSPVLSGDSGVYGGPEPFPVSILEERQATGIQVATGDSLSASVEAGIEPDRHNLLRTRRAWALGTILCGLVIAGVLIRLWAEHRSLVSSRSRATHSLAVLPFEFIGPDPNLSYLGPGLTDALVTRLSRQGEIAVRPFGAVKRYVGVTDLPRAGRDLQVDAVLDGTVQQMEGQIRVNAILLRVATGETIWAGTFDENSGKAFALEDSISQRLAEVLTPHLTEGQHRLTSPQTRSPEAYDTYTRGRVLLNDRSVESIRKSIALFEQAVRADPNYAAAYAGLADAYILAGSYGNSFLATSFQRPRLRKRSTRRSRSMATRPKPIPRWRICD